MKIIMGWPKTRNLCFTGMWNIWSIFRGTEYTHSGNGHTLVYIP